MRVTLCDVGPRDGLQNEPDVLPPEVRAELVNRLAAAGLPRIEAVSFVRDDRVPQMARRGGRRCRHRAARAGRSTPASSSTVKGYERLRATALDRVNCTFAATESFNQRNGNMSLEEALAQTKAIIAASDLPTTVTVSVAFGCPFEGRVDPGRVAELCEGLEADEVVLADTIGVGHADSGQAPRRADRRCAEVHRCTPTQHAQHRLRKRARSARSRRDGPRRVGRRPRWLSLRAEGHGEHRHGGPGLPARGRRGRDRSGPGRPDRRVRMARGPARASPRGLRVPRRRLAVVIRDYAGPEDLRRMQQLVQDCWALRGPAWAQHVGDLAWRPVPAHRPRGALADAPLGVPRASGRLRLALRGRRPRLLRSSRPPRTARRRPRVGERDRDRHAGLESRCDRGARTRTATSARRTMTRSWSTSRVASTSCRSRASPKASSSAR